MINNKYPYTDFNEYNLDWIILNMKKLLDYFEQINDFATEQYVQDSIAALKLELENKLVPMIDGKVDRIEYVGFVSEVQQSLYSMAGAIQQLQQQTAANAAAIVNTYNTLKAYIDDAVFNLTMQNPFTGQEEPIQIILNYIANLMRGDALTASEYDAALLTATAYDALDLTAYNYDNYGANYITP